MYPREGGLLRFLITAMSAQPDQAGENLLARGLPMEIKLAMEVEQTLTESIRRYVSENMETDIGELQASLFLKYCLEEIGPCVYNSAIADAQRYLQVNVSDLENACYAPEFGYWNNKSKRTATRHHPTKK